MILLLSGLLLWLAYALLIGFYRSGWSRSAAAPAAGGFGGVPLSVLVPARDERERLPALLRALEQQSYPSGSFEVLVIDDHSTDGTGHLAAAAAPNVHFLALPGGQAGKKAAIAYGVSQARGTLVVTTDADCLPGPEWLQVLAGTAHQQQSAFIAAPVRYRNPKGVCAVFQTLDFMTLQGITAASVATGFHSMCNGANLAYTREAFEAVKGFAGVDHIASGDDLLLMHKIAIRYPGRVHYLHRPEVIVDTDPAPGWRAFWKQRVRWASKSAQYDDKRITWALVLVFALNVWFFAAAAACFFHPRNVVTLLAILLLKTLVEIRFLAPVARFFGQAHLLKWFPLLQPLHICYTVLVGTLSQLGTYEWKGRRVK